MTAEIVTRAIDSAHPQAAAIDEAARVLLGGGLVMFPADTVYMMGTLATAGRSASPALERMFELKRRARTFSFPWLVARDDDLDVFGQKVSDAARRLAQVFWPGPLAIVVQASAAVPRRLARIDGTVSLRRSSHPMVAGILGACGKSLIVTSANTHGCPAPVVHEDIEQRLIRACDCVFYGVPENCQGPATIVDCSEGEAHIVRKGAISREAIAGALGHEPSDV